jgi:prophage antirepressor-like protein
MKWRITMINEDTLHTFYFEGQKIRAVIKDGTPWFVLDDVCEALQINPNELNENELAITKVNLNNLECNLIDFNSIKTNNGGHNGK